MQQTVKLIRSKGVGVLFCTQLPADVPGPVLSQLGARIQHALRAFTPDDAKALSSTVRTYPTSKVYDLQSALTSLATGEAIVTVLSETGAPTPVAWTRMRAPRSLMAPADPAAVLGAVTGSELQHRYGQPVDRESAYELLMGRLAGSAVPNSPTGPEPQAEPAGPSDQGPLPPVSGAQIPMPLPCNPYDPQVSTGTASAPEQHPRSRPDPASDAGGFLGDMLGSPVVSSFMRSLGTSLGGALGRSISGTRRRRRR